MRGGTSVRRLVGLLVLVPALLAAAPAAAQQLDPPEVEAPEPDVDVPDLEVPDGLPGLPPGDSPDGEDAGPQTQAAEDFAPFGNDCRERGGVLFCPTEGLDDRVPSFDDVPLDVDVTLPLDAEPNEALPTIVIMHGYGGTKEDFESDDPEGNDANERDYHYNNNFYAKRGYAVVNYTARGFGRSCGTEDSRDDPDCDDGYIHLADTRFEARDTQHLLGLLVDEGIADPEKLGVTGLSYGGGQSIELAMLNDRIRTCEGISSERSTCKPGTDEDPATDELEPWKSPDGTELSIAAAYPRWPWSDLVYSLVPNGRFVDTDAPTPEDEQSLEPLGIPIASYVVALYALAVEGFYCGEQPTQPCDDEQADITSWLARIQEGEDYEMQLPVPPGGAKPTYSGREIAEEIYDHHQGLGGFPVADEVPPILIQNGWTDDLFPPHEALRVYNYLRERANQDESGEADVSLQFGDLGHPRGSNKAEVDRAFNDQGARFLDERLGAGGGSPAPEGDAPEAGEVTAFTQTCPPGAPARGPFVARSWEGVHPGTEEFGDDEGDPSQTVTSANDDPYGTVFDPIESMQNPCERVADNEATPGRAVYRGEPSDGYTMIGRPTVTADIATTDGGVLTTDVGEGDVGQLDSRLWDVAPDGQQTLISRGAYRLENDQDEDGVTFQLNGNAWCFEEGHVPKLELLGKDGPYLRPSTGPGAAFSVDVSDVSVELPLARERGGCSSGDDGESGGGSGDGGDGTTGGGNGNGSGSGGNGGGGGGSNGNGGGDSDGGPAPPAPPSTVACLVARLGGPGPDSVFGTAGGDSIQGLGGADRLFGLAGDDCLFGGAGNDRLSGGPGNDRLSGAAGNDVLRGGPGSNAYSAGPGNDRLYTRDGAAQTVFCGSGRDRAWVDAGDTPRGCELVLRPRR